MFGHDWQIVGPIGLGGTYSIAWCECLRCGASRQRYLDGSESHRWLLPPVSERPQPGGIP